MISEMMKSSIPRNCASTREETFAGGGPWCSSCAAWPAATDADSIARRPPRSRSPRARLDAPDQVSAQPARARLRKRRDDDVVRRVELQRVLDCRVGIGVHDLPHRIEAGV